jgi:hypothetical protein
VHNALEPVIMKRLEGNNYLDCKLISTYGLPHSYSSDTDQYIEGVYWPDDVDCTKEVIESLRERKIIDVSDEFINKFYL